MSYPSMPPNVAAPAGPAPRPPAVTIAAALLWVMAVAGLIYAIVTIAVVPGVVSRFRSAVPASTDPETYSAVVWLGAAVALVLAVILVALYVVLGIALRRGSNAARIAILALCGLGALGGAISALIVVAERGGPATPGSLGERLTATYPAGWVPTNVGLAIAQLLGYVVVGILVLAAPKTFFGRGATPVVAATPAYGYGPFQPTQVGPYPGPSGPWGVPGAAQPGGYPGPTRGGAYPGPAQGGYPGPAQGGYPGPAQGGYPGPAQGGYPVATPWSTPTPGYAPSPGVTTPGPRPDPSSPGPATPQGPQGTASGGAPQPGADDQYWSRPSE